MAKPTIHIVPANETLKEKAIEALAAAMDENFEGVVVFGFKNGGFYQHWSHISNNVEKIGLLEEAKFTLLTRGN